MMKKCIDCGIEKEISNDYFPPMARNKDGHSNKCRRCVNKYNRAWKNLNKDRLNAERRIPVYDCTDDDDFVILH